MIALNIVLFIGIILARFLQEAKKLVREIFENELDELLKLCLRAYASSFRISQGPFAPTLLSKTSSRTKITVQKAMQPNV